MANSRDCVKSFTYRTLTAIGHGSCRKTTSATFSTARSTDFVSCNGRVQQDQAKTSYRVFYRSIGRHWTLAPSGGNFCFTERVYGFNSFARSTTVFAFLATTCNRHRTHTASVKAETHLKSDGVFTDGGHATFPTRVIFV